MRPASLSKEAFRFFNQHLTIGKPVLVAVSGGVDSVVLLHLLARYHNHRKDLVRVVHINHQLRETALRDQQFVERLGEEWGLSVETVAVELHAVPEHESNGTEADARDLRYDAFYRVASRLGISHLCLGHHADDQTETILWRLVRGTSRTGLSGMRRVAKRGWLFLLRPLLFADRQDILTYAAAYGLDFVEDETNLSTDYVRNYIRHNIIPHLKHLQPNFNHTIQKTLQIVQDEDDWLDEQARALVESACRRNEHQFHLNIEVFECAPRPLQRRAITIILYCLTSATWSFQHVESIVNLMAGNRPSGTVSLPHATVAIREYGSLTIRRDSSPVTSTPESLGEGVWVLRSHTTYRYGSAVSREWSFRRSDWTPSEGVRTSTLYELKIPRLPELFVRTVRPGDRVELLGMAGTKKLQDVFIDKKVPRAHRATWPVFCVGDTIVWVPGLIRAGTCLLQPHDREGWLITAVG